MTCIEVYNVTKTFTIVRDRARTVSGFFIDLIRFWRRLERVPFTALREIQLSVAQGEALGIIGANGSGKSTLLKLIAGIYAPTSGTISVRGSLVALLELGAGFHSELSGRQNILLNGTLYGHTRAEMARRVSEIAAFAEIEPFLETPIKYYSSGMQARLAFAVAMATPAEIILMDEVLAVGDMAFQARCLAKLRQLKAERRTLVLVSHSMDVVRELCDRAIWLDHGCLMAEGTPEEVVAAYQAHSVRQNAQIASAHASGAS
ncbi:MAG: ATP-binding protein [Candidatus Thermofonsia Clade 1 bacterium]|jgi:ABC-2 type transport system ATP-binding protein|uniref:ATP-binding protein n=1 Tax=Candidatus Thermofonsia Clade 1 bacterium TaxID=2364210 RepID=A0A2M8PCG2_9CHLR|nr:MAG: ATP-binding protein [Candidatus Thermofonsia Clade 1 bacterium]